MFGIRSRILVITVGTLAFAGVVSTLAIHLITRTTLEKQLVDRMQAELVHLGDRVLEPMLLQDRTALQQAVMDARKGHPEIEYIYVVSPSGEVLSSSFWGGVPRDLLAASRVPQPAGSSTHELSTERGLIFDVARTAMPGLGGEIHMGVRAAPILEVVTEAVDTLLWIEGAALLLALLGAFVMADLLTRPLHNLLAVVERVGAGDLSVSTGIRSSDEVGRLAQAFDTMVARLLASRNVLRELAARDKAIVSCFPNALLVTDAAGEIVSANPAALALSGLSEATIIGRHVSSLFVSGSEGKPIHDLGSALQREQTTLSYEMALRQADGRTLPVAFNAAPMILGHRFRGFVIEVRNLNHLRSAIAALKIQYDRLEEQGAGVLDLDTDAGAEVRVDETHLVRSDRLVSLGQLAASVAHELNNPIFSIITSARVIQRDLTGWPSDEPTRGRIMDGLRSVVSESKRCSSILRGFLRYARAGSPGWDLVDVQTVLQDVHDLVAAQALEQQVEIEPHCEEIAQVKADPQQLHQVFLNIEINALQAMEDGGRLVVRTVIDEVAGNVEVRFEDTGVGIAPDVVPKVFMPFFTTKDRQQGTGLGLAVARGIVRRMGGEITLTSSQGKGTTVRLVIPVAAPPSGSVGESS